MAFRILFFISVILVTFTYAAVPLQTQPKTVKEYVYVHASGSGGRAISRKEKVVSKGVPFETSHKLPPYVTYKINEDDSEATEIVKSTKQKREAASPAPAPAGSIKLDPRKLLEKYKDDLKTSSTAAPKVSTKPSRKRRTKKEATPDPIPTSPRPVLTSGAPPTPRSLRIEDSKLVASGSEKQRSRIQIKKGPNGQEYEYEYVYYYYDDDDDDKETTEKVSNSHDGPSRDELATKSEEKTHYSKEAASNEVIPTGRGRSRGRQLEDEDTVGEDRLPPSTRFPPRSRNLASTTATPSSEEEAKTTRARGRGRGTTVSSTASTEADSVSEETQGSRGRTRANVRRPSLDLVDSASFNTHSGTAGAEPPSGGPSFPSDLPSGPVRFLGATPNERMDLQETEGKEEKPSEARETVNTEAADSGDPTISTSLDATTTMSPMDKVALDLYAILQGTQKLSGEGELEDSTATTGEAEVTTLEAETTEASTTEYTTPSTTTTTTTTTTPLPTTTTTTEAPLRGFRRGSNNRRKHGSTTSAPSTTEAGSSDSKPKGSFGRPRFGRPRPGARTTAEPAHEPESTKEESKPVSRSRPTSKSRFGVSRTRPSTTESSSDHASDEGSSSTSKPALSRPRPGFNLRGRGRSTTAAPAEAESSADGDAHSESASSTTKPRLRPASGGSNVRPLRPGPRINLARGRPGAAATTTTPVPDAPAEETHQEEVSASEDPKEDSTSSAPVEDKNPLNRLRNRQRAGVAGATTAPSTQVRPKAAASAPVQVRRVNPLLGRRRPGATAEPSTTEAAHEPEPTEAIEEGNEETEASASSSTTTEEPKGLNKLLAGRRRLAIRQPGSHK